VIQQEDRTWLLMRTKPQADRAPGVLLEQSLFALDTRIGALSPIPGVRIGPEDRVCGITLPRGNRVRFASGPLTVVSPRASNVKAPSREARLRCLDLDRGEIWVQALGVGYDDLQLNVLPAPAISTSTIALVYSQSESRARTGMATTQLAFFDRHSGLSGGKRELRNTEKADNPQLSPLGDMLIVRTKSALEILR
jgi:hypothetical protein